jgi:hypothetical protein
MNVDPVSDTELVPRSVLNAPAITGTGNSTGVETGAEDEWTVVTTCIQKEQRKY